jgi:hypothetical protein
MTGIRRNRASAMSIIAVAILLILAIPSLMPDVSGQGPGIALVDSTGTELGDRSFMTSQVGFDTEDTKEGTRYLLAETTEIETIETYIRWVDLYAGFFDLRISVSPADGGSYGFLSTTGITIAVYDGDTPYYAVLDPDDGYEAVVSDIATGEPHSFQPGQDDNRIRVYTNQSYDSYTAPTDALKLTFTFTAESQDLHLIEYISEAEIVGTKLLPGDAELGDPPQVSRSGYDLLGWKDSNGRMVTPQTVVATLPSDQLTAEWTPSGGDDDWPKIDVEDKDVVEPDGTEVHTETTTIRYEDGTRTVIIEKVIDHPNGDETLMEQVTTTYPDRKKDTTTTLVTETTHDDGSKDIAFEYEQRLRDGTWTITESTESYDPVTRLILRDETTESGDSQGTISKSGSDVEIVYHDDGTVTRTERTYDEDRSGHRHEEEKVQELNRDEDLTRESRDIRITEPGMDPREYGIEYVVTTDDRTVYATMADLNPADMDVIQDIIDEYDYTEDFIGVFRDDGVLTVSDGMLPIISEMGCGLYAHRGPESVSVDAEIVAALAKGEGVLELRIEDAAGHMNPRQERAVGGSYAVSVTLAMDSEFVTDLPGKAEIVLEPGYYSADAFRVEEDGTLTRIDAEYDWETGAVSFAVDHFSIYMVEMHKEPPKELPWMWIAVGIAALAAMLLIIFAAAKRRRRSDA